MGGFFGLEPQKEMVFEKNFLRDEQQESQDSYGNPNQCGVQADQQGFPLIFFPELGLFDSFRFTNFGAEIV